MTKDVARPRQNGGSLLPPVRWLGVAISLLAGLLLGISITLLAFYAGWVPQREAPLASGSDEQGERPPPGVRFEFPDLLRDAEVLVPYVEEYLQQGSAEPATEYLLQAGAFRNEEDANRRRAKLLLLDLEVQTRRVTRQGESWHRVLVGPFLSREAVRHAQARLLDEKVDTIVLTAWPRD